MKMLDEVIKALDGFFVCPSVDEANQYCEVLAIVDDALHYLKEYREITDVCHSHGIASVWGHLLPDPDKTDKTKKLNFDNAYDNDPLTWDELKQMEGKPVWVEGEHGCIWNQKAWSLIRLDPENDDIVICINTDNGVFYEFAIDQEDYGTDWQAYRKERNED